MKWTDQSPSLALPIAPPTAMTLPLSRTLCAKFTRASGVQVQIHQSVHQQVLKHLRTSDQELGGLLIGLPYGNAQTPTQAALVQIIAAVAATQSSGTGYSLRMEAAVWSDANESLRVLQQTSPQARIVGWYHSHPGLGAFFSATDCSTQAAFFNQAYSVGWVIDPSDDSHACFVGPESQTVGICALVETIS